MSEHTNGRQTGQKQPLTERESLRRELNSARALLREVAKSIQEHDTRGIFDQEKLKIRAYLDACDKPGEPDAS